MDVLNIPDIGQSTASGLQPLIQQTLAQQTGNDQLPEMIEQGTRALENSTAIALQAMSVLTKLGPVPLSSWREMVDRFTEDQVGAEASPAAKLAAEQALILHHGSVALRVTAAGTTDPTVVQCNVSQATSMQCELRKLLVDLERFRMEAEGDGGTGLGVVKAAASTKKRTTKKRQQKSQSVA